MARAAGAGRDARSQLYRAAEPDEGERAATGPARTARGRAGWAGRCARARTNRRRRRRPLRRRSARMQRVVPVQSGLPLSKTRGVARAEASMTGRKRQLGVQQAAAINAAGNLLIRSCAGSGKTEVLARRMVALLAGDSDGGSPQAGGLAGRPPLAPEAIAAITFTEKAALDMCARIAGVLEERIAEAAESAPARCEVLVQARRRLALARISTIHAFCARILRENPVAAGLDPGFEVLDEYESATFFERSCRETLVAAVRRDDPGARFLIRARRLRGSVYREGALDLLQRILTETGRRGRDAAWILAQAEQSVAQLADRKSTRL